MSTIFVILIFFVNCVFSRDSDYCYADDKKPYHGMATRTAYSFVHGNFSELQPAENCEPRQIWVFSRHGTRYPNRNAINDIQWMLPKLRDSLVSYNTFWKPGHICDKDLENLRNWVLDPEIREENAKMLSEQGILDLENFAMRLKNKYPNLLDRNAASVRAKNFKFRASNSPRAQLSMNSFMLGLFNDSSAVQPRTTPEKDLVLKAHRDCDTWVETNCPTMIGLQIKNKFTESKEFKNLVKNVSDRWNLRNSIDLKEFFRNDPNISITKVVLTMYEMCRSDMSLHVWEISPWCAIFTHEELRILEYREDIDYYYYSGPGREDNKKIGCFPLKDMFEHFGKLEGQKNGKEPLGVFYFSHDGPLQTLYSAMEFFDNSRPLTESNYHEMKNHPWKTSEISPFAANLVAVFYNCNDKKKPHKVRFFIAEKPVRYKGCKEDLCDWEFLKRKFHKTIAECKTEFCETGKRNFEKTIFRRSTGCFQPRTIRRRKKRIAFG